MLRFGRITSSHVLPLLSLGVYNAKSHRGKIALAILIRQRRTEKYNCGLLFRHPDELQRYQSAINERTTVFPLIEAPGFYYNHPVHR